MEKDLFKAFSFTKIWQKIPFVQKPSEVLLKKEFLKNFTKFKGKHLCWSLFFKKDSGLRPATLLKKRLQQKFFLWILWSFQEHLFYRTLPNDFFSNLSHSFILHRSFIYLFGPSFVRKIHKNSQFWYLFILQIHLVLYIVNVFYTIDQNINRSISPYEVIAVLQYYSTKYLSVFSPNAGKYGPEITPYLDTFHAVSAMCFLSYKEQWKQFSG